MCIPQGNSVRLDVSKLDAFRLFPGQVVAVEGTNPSGHCIIASRLVTLLPQPMPTSPPTQLASMGESLCQQHSPCISPVASIRSGSLVGMRGNAGHT